jgi:tRNA(Ile)-lysidine synthetase-like protein
MKAGDRVGVAVSGGIDSVALLRLLLELRGELGIVLSVVHFNHKLRGAESDDDQEFVAVLAREYDLDFHTDSDDVAQRAAEEHVSIETAARELRYGFFQYLLGAEGEKDPSGAEAPMEEASEDRSAESAAPPKSESEVSKGGPHRLKPGPLTASDGAAGSRALSNPAIAFSDPGMAFSNPDAVVSRAATVCLNAIVTGHTLDDQAETVLMRMIRGAGLRGLGGIHTRILVEDEEGEASGEIVRPLLGVRRRDLEQYLNDIGQAWREDSTNTDERFTRNRVRKLVVPLLEQEFNPAVAENLAELAEIARGEEDYWENEVSGWLGTTVQWTQPAWARGASSEFGLVQISPPGDGSPRTVPDSDLRTRIDSAPWLVMNAAVSRMWFLGESMAVQRRVVKAIGASAGISLEFKHIEEILRRAAEDDATGKAVPLPLGWKVLLEPEQLVFVTPDLREPAPFADYDYELPVPGRITVYEAGSSLEVRRVPAGAVAGYNPDHLFDAEMLPAPLRVRNWRAGDRFWPAHTKSPRKIKELLQGRHVAQPARKSWPVVVSGNEIVWLRGFLSPARLRAKPGRAAIMIVDEPLADRPARED